MSHGHFLNHPQGSAGPSGWIGLNEEEEEEDEEGKDELVDVDVGLFEESESGKSSSPDGSMPPEMGDYEVRDLSGRGRVGESLVRSSRVVRAESRSPLRFLLIKGSHPLEADQI